MYLRFYRIRSSEIRNVRWNVSCNKISKLIIKFSGEKNYTNTIIILLDSIEDLNK